MFNPPHSKRFHELRKSSNANSIAKEAKLYPGPGHYPPSQAITKSGNYFLSKFRSSMCRRFGSEHRETLPDSRATFVFTPGPGAYRAPSEFGHYQAQNKYVEEADRLDSQRKIQVAGTAKNAKNGLGQASVQRLTATASGISRSSSQPTLATQGKKNASAIVEIHGGIPPKAAH